MARFVFSLRGVLSHRRRLERAVQRELAGALAEQARLEGQLRDLEQQVLNANAELRGSHLTGRLDLSYITGHRRYIMAMGRQANDLVNSISRQRLVAQEVRVRLAAAARDRKVIEKLREKRYLAWKAGVDLKEQMELDDISMKLAFGDFVQPRTAAG